jgi:DNA-directed RNA polymerase sigma subunit (sigma70/sigma32)
LSTAGAAVENRLRQTLQREPTGHEVAGELGIPAWKIAELERVAEGALRLEGVVRDEGTGNPAADEIATGAGEGFVDHDSTLYERAEVETLIKGYAEIAARARGSRDELALNRTPRRAPGRPCT